MEAKTVFSPNLYKLILLLVLILIIPVPINIESCSTTNCINTIVWGSIIITPYVQEIETTSYLALTVISYIIASIIGNLTERKTKIPKPPEKTIKRKTTKKKTRKKKA